ncbi:MAG TPA: hypothetical protein VGX23_03510 [Actinocrinis sp.]|nr:hypothetical protein [Actinocrinis sp.]
MTATSAPGREIALPRLVRELDAAAVHPLDVALRRPSLDDVFLALTGPGARPGSDQTSDSAAESQTQEGNR